MRNPNEENLEHFTELDIQKPSDLIIQQIRSLIVSGKLQPGMNLPSERALSERFGVGRGYVREAIRKLEFYGILRTEPKKHTKIASMGVKALEGIISNILAFGRYDLQSLFETRAVLETYSARSAAHRADSGHLSAIGRCHTDFIEAIRQNRSAIDEDHLFHLKIAEASRNPVLSSLISLITPDIITMNTSSEQFEQQQYKQDTILEHEAVLTAIIAHDPEAAGNAMEEHMKHSFARRFPEGTVYEVFPQVRSEYGTGADS